MDSFSRAEILVIYNLFGHNKTLFERALQVVKPADVKILIAAQLDAEHLVHPDLKAAAEKRCVKQEDVIRCSVLTPYERQKLDRPLPDEDFGR